MIKVLGLALYGPLAASNRYRLGQYAPVLEKQGIELQVCDLLGDDYLHQKFAGRSLPITSLLRSVGSRLVDLQRQHKYDLIMLHCELFPLMPGLLERGMLRRPFIYDFDDAFYLKYRSGRLGLFQSLLGHKFDVVMKGAAAVTAGNLELERYAKKYNTNTHYLPTVVDTDRYKPANKNSEGKVFLVGWIGSPSTAAYLTEIVEPLSILGQEEPVRLLVIGGKAPKIPYVSVVEIDWQEHAEVDLINTFDVGIMPLPDEPWTRGKCGFKLIQYMACGLPVVASPVGVNKEIVEHGVNGFLAETDDEWMQALATLRDNPDLRKRMGEAGRRKVEDKYSLQFAAPRLIKLIRSLQETS